MKKSILCAAIISVLALSVITFKGYDVAKSANPQTNQNVIHRNTVYDADVTKPEFLNNQSDVVVIGKIVNKNASAKGKLSVGLQEDVVYTDTNVKVETVVINKTSNQIKHGDTLTVRNLGGTADNLTMITDTDGVLKQDKNDKKVLLFLADLSRDLSLPQGGTQTTTYSIVGGFHGSFSLSGDGGEATRDVSGEKIKTDDLVKLLKNK
ncbi:MAG TPA: hypothetical protein VN456_02260 [Desulfosporosinus sp.]|nr:hypothetical protein [Desulfosporosinus sp.]